MFKILFPACLLTLSCYAQQELYVSPAGNNSNPGTLLQPFKTAQYAVDHAVAGTTVYLMGGSYHENIVMSVSGTIADPVTLSGYNGEIAIIDGSATMGNSLIRISGKNSIVIRDIVFTGLQVNHGSALLIENGSQHISVRNNKFYGINFSADPAAVTSAGDFSCAVRLEGNDVSTAVSSIEISGNEISNCRTGNAAAAEITGNVNGFSIEKNSVHDLPNSGIGITGNTGICALPQNDKPRSGRLSGNFIWNCASADETTSGIISNGSLDCWINNNTIYNCTNGITFLSSANGTRSSELDCRNNLIYHCHHSGITTGNTDYIPGAGYTEYLTVFCNTLFGNNTDQSGAELLIGYGENCHFRNNIIDGNTDGGPIVKVIANSLQSDLDYNLYYSLAPVVFEWMNTTVNSLTAWQSVSLSDTNSISADPQFINAGFENFHLHMNSPAIDHGDPFYITFANEADMDTMTRVQNGRLDIGADEYGTTVGIAEEAPNTTVYYYDSEHSQFIVRVPAVAERSFVYLYDASGRLLSTQELKKGESTVNFSNQMLPSGIYIAQVNGASLKMAK